MNRSNLRLGALLALSLWGALWASAQPYNPHGEDNWRRSIKSQADFAFRLYQALDEDAPEANLIFSPYSLYLALNMTYEGARGQTAEQMAALLFSDGGADAGLRSAYQASLDDLAMRTPEGSGAALFSASRLYGDQGYGFNAGVLNEIERLYDAPFGLVDFAGDSEGARAEINQWVSEQTRQQIEELIPSGEVNSLTRLVLANALYFGGIWKEGEAFDEADTKEQPFTRLDGTQVSVPLMSQEAKRRLYYAAADYEVVFLPFGSSGVGLLAVLPAQGQFEAVEAQLGADWYAEVMDGLDFAAVSLFLPRWETRQALNASDVLRRLGMVDAFDDTLADLSGFSAPGAAPLTISAVLHQAALKLDEEGAEASAATAVIGTVRSAPPSVDSKRAIELRFDRPFIYAIVDQLTYTPLFVGRLMDPTQAQEGG